MKQRWPLLSRRLVHLHPKILNLQTLEIFDVPLINYGANYLSCCLSNSVSRVWEEWAVKNKLSVYVFLFYFFFTISNVSLIVYKLIMYKYLIYMSCTEDSPPCYLKKKTNTQIEYISAFWDTEDKYFSLRAVKFCCRVTTREKTWRAHVVYNL